MEFKDYYQILQVSQTATVSEIKMAYRKQAIKWHPDKNPNSDTTAKMQEISEAYLILKDIEARERYDREYLRYKEFISKREKQQTTYSSQSQNYGQNTQQTTYETEYEFDDEVLRNWMRNARRQAVDLAKETLKDIGKLSVTATKAAGKEMLGVFVGYFITGLILFIIFRACAG